MSTVVVARPVGLRAEQTTVPDIVEAARQSGHTVLAVCREGDRPVGQDSAECPGLRWLEVPGRPLVPELWAQGMLASQGESVVLTLDGLRPQGRWPSALDEALGESILGTGGVISLASDASLVTAAVYFLRYSGFIDTDTDAASITVDQIAGDNACYSMSALDTVRSEWARGFWEVEVHHVLAGEQHGLRLVPAASSALVFSPPFGAMARERFRHARRFGRWRRRTTGTHPLKGLLASPVVPVVLWLRALKRVRHSKPLLRRLLMVTPHFLGLAAVWASGELVGLLGSGSDTQAEAREKLR